MKFTSLFTEQRRQAAKRTMKGSAAFTSALLFGTNESQGLLRTLGQASAEAGKNVWDALPEKRNAASTSGFSENKDGYRDGAEGTGYYFGGIKLDD